MAFSGKPGSATSTAMVRVPDEGLQRRAVLPVPQDNQAGRPATPDLRERPDQRRNVFPPGQPAYAEHHGQSPVVLGVGRLTRQKDFSTLIRAFAEVRRHGPARLIILGDGEDRSALEALVGELGIAVDVALPGFRENAMAYMARSALFVLSSAWEGLPTVLIEALAVGTRVLSTDCRSGPREILGDGALGALVPVGDVPAMATAILRELHRPRRAIPKARCSRSPGILRSTTISG